MDAEPAALPRVTVVTVTYADRWDAGLSATIASVLAEPRADLIVVSNGAAPDSAARLDDAVARSTNAISRAADRLRDEAETSAANAREHLSATVRDHPVATNLGSSFVLSLVVALAVTFGLMRLSQS